VRIHSGNGVHEEMDRRASLVSIRRWKMSGSPATSGCEVCCAITSRGLPRPRWLVTIARQRMCRTVCKFRSGPGTDSSAEGRRRESPGFLVGATTQSGERRACTTEAKMPR
jgi:hypothetical protein